jgi:hypothetical protein
MGVNQRTRADIARKPRHRLKEGAREQHRVTAPATAGGDDNASSFLRREGRDQPVDDRGAEPRHVAEADERAVARRGQRRNPGAQRGGKPLGVVGIVDKGHRQMRERRLNPLTLIAGDDQDRPRTRGHERLHHAAPTFAPTEVSVPATTLPVTSMESTKSRPATVCTRTGMTLSLSSASVSFA